MGEILPASAKTETSEEIKEERRKAQMIGTVVIFMVEAGKRNWKYMLIVLALLFNSPYTRSMIENATGWKFSGPTPMAAEAATAPVSEAWKASVNYQLKDLKMGMKNLETQQKLMLQILTTGE